MLSSKTQQRRRPTSAQPQVAPDRQAILDRAIHPCLEGLEGRRLLSVGAANWGPLDAAVVKGFQFDYRNGIVSQTDGKVLVAGYVNNVGTGHDVAVARYNVDGTLDTGYGTGGVAVLALAGSQEGKGIALDPSGRATVAVKANAGTVYGFAVARFTAGNGPGSGVADTSFDTDGFAQVNFNNGNENAAAIAVRPTGEIVVGGAAQISSSPSARYDFAIAQFTSAGGLDSSFDGDGKLTNNAIGGNSDQITDMSIQPDGKIVVAGSSAVTGGGDGTAFVVKRFAATGGSGDGTFNGGNAVVTTFGLGTVAGASGITVQSDGKIVASGSVTNTTSGDVNFGIARYTSAGALDTATFNGTGKVVINFGSTDIPGSIAMETLGATQKIVVSGSSGSHGDIAVARLNLDGSLDNTFSGDGKATFAYGDPDVDPNSGVERVPGLAIQTLTGPFRSNILVAGVNTADGLILASIDGNTATLNTVYVNDDWAITNNVGPATLSTGDTVYDSESGISATYGVDGFATIQDGENAVTAGGLVDVLRGSYQYFTANKASTIKSHYGNTSATVTGGDIGGLYTVNLRASNVTFDGFTVTNPNYGIGDPWAQTGDPQGIALGWYGDTLSNVHVKNNIVSAIANNRTLDGAHTPISPAYGIEVGGDVSNFEIDHNTVQNMGANVSDGSVTFAAVGIQADASNTGGSSGSVHDNVVQNFTVNNSGAGNARTIGINVTSGAGNVSVTNNTVTGIQGDGIRTSTGVTIAHDILRNTVYGNTTGIRIAGPGGANLGTANPADVNIFDGGANPDNATDLRLDSTAANVTLGNGNAFSGDTYFIDNRSAQAFDLTSNSTTYEGLNPNVLANAFRIEDKMFHKTDASASGLIRVKTGNIYVTTPGTGASDESVQRGIDAASANDTVNVESGTFKENIIVNKALTLLGANSGTAGSAPRLAESIITTNGNANSVVSLTSSGVTIDGFTIDGDDTAVNANNLLTSGDDANVLYGIRPSSNQSNLLIQNNIVKHAFIGFRGDGASANPNTITANWFDSIGAYDFGYAVSIRDNYYANITNNLMTRVHSALHTNNQGTAAPGGVFNFTGNTVTAYGAGVWYNQGYSLATPLTISGNTISSLVAPVTAANSSVRANYDGKSIGVLVAALSSNVPITITGNSITGMGYGVAFYNTDTTATPSLGASNIINNNGVGVYITNIMGFNPITSTVLGGAANNPNGNTQAALNGAVLSGNTIGVLVRGDNPSTAFTAAANIKGNTSITGGTSGVVVTGSAASANIHDNAASINGNTIGIDVTNNSSATITNNHIYDNGTGIRLTTGGTAAVTSNNFVGPADNGTDIRLDSTAGALTLGNGNAFAGNTYYIDNQSAQNLDLTSNTSTFEGLNRNVLADAFRIEDKMFHKPDATASGLIRLVANQIYVTAPGTGASDETIQRGIDAAVALDTVNVEAGTFKENINVNKTLTLLGANSGTAGSAPRVAESIITTNGNQSSVVALNANGVTIDGFKIDGDDTAVSGGNALTSGEDANVSFDIRAAGGQNNITIRNNVLTHAAQGFRGDNASQGNLITNNWFDSIGFFDFGYAVSIRGNYYADVTNNLMTRVHSGLHSLNHFGAGGPAQQLFTGNTVSAYAAGVWDNQNYNQGTPLTIANNTFTGLTAPSTPANNAPDVRSNYDGNSTGILLTTLQNNVGVTISNNSITNMGYGVIMWNTEGTATPVIDGSNTISGNGTGIYVANIVGFNPVSRTTLGGTAAPGWTTNHVTGVTRGIVDGATLSNNTIGVKVNGDPAEAFGASVEIRNDTNITGATTGVLVQGSSATANIHDNDNSISGNTTGISVTGGNATINNNHLFNNGIHIDVSGGTATITNNLMEVATTAQLRTSVDGLTISNNTFNGALGTNIKRFDGVGTNYNIPTLIGNNTWETAVTDQDGSLVYQQSVWANLQGGINASAAGHTVTAWDANNVVAPTTYKESNINVAIPITIKGSSRPDVVIAPAIVDGHVDDNFTSSSNAFLLSSSGVSIKDMTIDGNGNGALSGTKNYRNAVLTNYPTGNFGNETVDNVSIKNIFRKGVGYYVTTSNKATGDSITNSSFDGIGANGLGFEGTFAIAAFQSDTTINNVQITNSAGGIGTNYFVSDAYAPLMNISNVNISSMTPAGTNPVLGMDLSGMADNSSVTNNTINTTGGTTSDIGIVVQYTATNADVTVSGNNITSGAGDTGIMLYQVQSQAHPAVVTGNTLGGAGTGTGILTTIDGSFFGETPNVGTTWATLTSNNVSGYGVGVDVTGAAASADITSNIVNNNGTGVRVNNSASPVNVITNTITNNTTAGVTISNVPVLNYTDNVLTGNAAGGSFTNITKVNYTASASTNDSFTVTPTVMSDNGNQTITYTLVPTLNVRTLGGDDTILAGPASGLTVWADAGTGTNDLVSWEGAGGNDDVQFSTAPTVGPDISATESVYRTGNTARLNIANAETRRIRTFGGDDAINYVRFGGSVATGFVIESGDNNDNVLGGLGNDTILGGDGDDRIDAANGNDSVLGEAGNDTMFGGVGNDFMDVGSGENQAFGQNGNDTIWAQNGNLDFVDGGAGFDTGKVDGIDLISSLESLI